MDPVAATGIAYAAETAIEAGVAGYYLTVPTLPLKATLEHIASTSPTPRSSHSVSVVGEKAYIFGGSGGANSELQSGQAASNDIEELQISTTERTTATSSLIHARGDDDAVPTTRIDHTSVASRNRVFIFGGRKGSKEGAIDEGGRLWAFDPLESSWLFLDPPPHTDFPCARYQHASTSSADGNVIYIHAGCASDGALLDDSWAFNLDEGKWSRLPDAPGAARCLTSIACGNGRLWRFGGFDGSNELNELDFLDLEHPAVGIDDKQAWKPAPVESSQAPTARSQAALQYVTTGKGREYLILALGEGDPQSTMTPNDGKLLADIWAYQLPSSGLSGAGVKDAIRGALPGVKTHEGEWAPVEITGIEVGADEKRGGKWTGRSKFGSAMTGTKQFMLWGGVDEHNERLGDGWMIKIQ